MIAFKSFIIHFYLRQTQFWTKTKVPGKNSNVAVWVLTGTCCMMTLTQTSTNAEVKPLKCQASKTDCLRGQEQMNGGPRFRGWTNPCALLNVYQTTANVSLKVRNCLSLQNSCCCISQNDELTQGKYRGAVYAYVDRCVHPVLTHYRHKRGDDRPIIHGDRKNRAPSRTIVRYWHLTPHCKAKKTIFHVKYMGKIIWKKLLKKNDG